MNQMSSNVRMALFMQSEKSTCSFSLAAWVRVENQKTPHPRSLLKNTRDVPFRFEAVALICAAFEFGASGEGWDGDGSAGWRGGGVVGWWGGGVVG